MFFGKRPTEPGAPDANLDDPYADFDDVPESERGVHKGYAIIPRVKQLHNGNWIVRVVLQEDRQDGPRRYDFLGPMTEYASAQEAKRAGVEHAIERLDHQFAGPTPT